MVTHGMTDPHGDAPTQPLESKRLADAFRADHAAYLDRHPAPEPVAGTTVAGRYRLLVPHGGRQLLQFWQAVDLATGAQVAVTLVDPGGVLAAEQVNEILARTVRLRGVATAGVAPILEVRHTGDCGLVVAEWVRGASLRQVADTAPAPVGVAGALRSLAEAAEAAHRAGLVLSLDDPARLRVSVAGHAVLAFPATMPDTEPRDDLRGIGSALYALLVSRWPYSDDVPAGWTGVEADSAGRPPEPAAVNGQIPFLLSATASGLVRQDGGIASAATLLTLLTEAAATTDDEPGLRVLAPLPPPHPGGYAEFRGVNPAERAEAARRGLVRLWLGAAAVIMAVAVVLAGSTINGLLDDGETTAGPDAEKLGLNAAAPDTTPPTRKARAAVTPVKPVEAAVFSPDGSPDSPGSAGAAIDGDPATAWSTSTYYDAEPFPSFKSGVGLAVRLPEPRALGAVTVDLDSTGTVVQIRSADTLSPANLEDTTAISPPTPMQPGANSIPVSTGEPVSHVVVWIATLGSTDGKNRSSVSEIGVLPAPPPA